ncbi:MAG: VPLPA-CTERM sorting domain-containing protein [Proteobacteria bacterium]|nr:VPLPA-CTERM sorting domain-containing protein [Pseudomonadota bacterium]
MVSFIVGSGLATFIGENIRFGFTAGTGSASSLHEVFDFSTTPVPLPAAAWLLLSGLAGLGFVGRRRTMA